MVCNKCGSDRFIAHQVCHHDILVDGKKNFIQDKEIYYAGNLFEPYTCVQCGAEYSEEEMAA